MKIRFLLLSLFAGFSVIAAHAQDFSGKYTGNYEGNPIVLALNSSGDNLYDGELNDGTNTFSVTGTGVGPQIKGECKELRSGLTMTMLGTLENGHLSLSLGIAGIMLSIHLLKEGTAAPVTDNAPDGKERDPAIVGRWTRQSQYNSGYGQGSMSSEASMIFMADGRVADGGTRTVVSGADWSGNSSSEGGTVVEGLIWYSENRQIYLRASKNGQTETQCLGQYYIEDGKMLVTALDGTKVLFYRG